MKKIVMSGILVVSAVAVLLTGCNSNSEKKGSATPSDDRYPVVKVGYVFAFAPTDEKAIETELNKIMREKAHAEIDLVGMQFGNFTTQLNLMLTGSGDTSIDLFNSFLYSPLSSLVNNGQVLDLSELMKNEGKDITALFDSNGIQDYMKVGQIGGKTYGIPSVTAYSNENLDYAKKENAQKAGIDWSKVNSIDSMSDAILQLKKANPDKYFIPGSTQIYWVPKNIDSLGDTNLLGVLLDPTNVTKIENYYESDYFIKFLGHVEEWKKNNVFSPDPLSNNNATLNNLQMGITNGIPGYAWNADVNLKATEAQLGLELEGAKVTEALATTSEASAILWHISAFSKDPEAAMKVLSVLYTDPDAAQLVGNGVEGLEYEMNADGQMVYPEGKSGMADLGWPAASAAVWPNHTLNKTWYFEPKDIYTKMIDKNKTANKSLALGFTFDSSTVADQITACTNVVAQYYTPLMYGEVDIDAVLPTFQKALKEAGIDEIIAEKQKQLDAWLANR